MTHGYYGLTLAAEFVAPESFSRPPICRVDSTSFRTCNLVLFLGIIASPLPQLMLPPLPERIRESPKIQLGPRVLSHKMLIRILIFVNIVIVSVESATALPCVS